MPLLEQSRFEIDGARGHVVEYDGVLIRMYDDALTAIKVIQLFEDKSIHELFKFRLLLDLLFPNPDGVLEAIGDWDGLVQHCVSELCGLDVSKGRAPDKDVLNLESDAPYINASLWQTYGLSLDSVASQVTFQELIELISLTPFETSIGQAIYYRTAKPPKRTKYNSEEIKDFHKRKRFWALKTSKDAIDQESGNGAMTDAFSALRRAVNARG